MGKALLLYSEPGGIASGNEIPVLGGGVSNATEANSQITFPVAGTFSMLGTFNLGGSGTNTVQFRVNGANGNLVTAASGTGLKEDTSNSDTISANDEVNIACTDTGSNPTASHYRLVWEATSDHCTMHAARRPAGTACDATNARYGSFAGSILQDWNATEAQTQLKARCASTASHFQISASVNASDETRAFTFRLNGADGNGTVSFGAGATGIAIDTSNTDTLADGDLFNAYMAPLQATDDITLTGCCILVTNTTTDESDVWHGSSNTGGSFTYNSPTTTYYALGGSGDGTTTAANRAVQTGFAGTARNLRVYASNNTLTSDATLKLKNLTDTTEISLTLTGSGGAGWYENTSDTLNFDATDDLVLEFDGGGAASPFSWYCIGITLSDGVVGDTTIGGYGSYYRLLQGMSTPNA